MFRCGVLTLSDKGAVGLREDTAGPAVQALLSEAGLQVAVTKLLADKQDVIAECLIDWCDEQKLDLIITTGGTGVAPSDVTPEATLKIIDRQVPGLAEAMRLASLQKTPQAVWSRGVAGIRGQSLIINVPGSEKAAKENLAAILPALSHGLYKLTGGKDDCGG